jgi:hypothetical protein
MQIEKVQQIFFQIGPLKLNPYRQIFKYGHYNDRHFTKNYYIVQKSVDSFLHSPLHITSIMICIGQSFCYGSCLIIVCKSEISNPSS